MCPIFGILEACFWENVSPTGQSIRRPENSPPLELAYWDQTDSGRRSEKEEQSKCQPERIQGFSAEIIKA